MTPRPVESIELEGRSTACSCVDIIEDDVVISEHSATASHTGSLEQAASADLDSDNADREQDANLPPADRGMQAWCFLLAAFVVEAIVWSFPFTYGVFLESYLSDPTYATQSHATALLPLIGTISSGIMYCAGTVLHPAIVRYPRLRRPAVWVGATLCSASLFCASYTTKISALFGLQGVVYAIGGSLLYFPTIFYMNEWFFRLRGTASGIVFAGTAAGGLILPLVFPPLITKYGAPKTLRIFCVAIACLLLPVIPYIKGRLPPRVYGPAPRASNRGWLTNPSFWLYTAVNLIQGFGYFMPVVWLPTFASDMSLGSLESAAALAALNGASVVGGLLMGYLSDHFNAWLLALGSLVSTALATFILWGVLGNSFAGLVAFGVAYGIVAGSFSSLWMSFARMYAKEEPGLSTTLFGYICLCRGIGNVLSTPIATALTSKSISSTLPSATGFAVGGGRFESMIIYSGTCFAGAAGLAVFGWRSELWSLHRQ